MAYDEDLAARVRQVLAVRSGLTERKMFGGLAFMLDGNMCCGVLNDELMVRVGVDNYAEMVTQPDVRPMDFTGRPMRGMIYVSSVGCSTDAQLAQWVNCGGDFAASLPRKK